MQMPIGWQGLRGTLGVQLAHLHEQVAAQVLPVPKQPSRHFRGTRAADGLSAAQVARIVARNGGKWVEPAKALAAALGITRWRVEALRERERERMAKCAS